MREYRVEVAINDADLSMMVGYTAGDRLVPIGLTFIIPADSYEEARNKMWEIGNREGQDADGCRWPSGVRSVSVGDVITVREVPGGAVFRSWVANLGFEELEP